MDTSVGDRSHLGEDFWANAPLEYVKSGKRSPSARGRNVPIGPPKAMVVNPERTRMGAFKQDYETLGPPIRTPSEKQSRTGSQDGSRMTPNMYPATHAVSDRVTYDLSHNPQDFNQRRQAWPPQEPRENFDRGQFDEVPLRPLSRPGWDPTMPRTPPKDLPPTPMERHRTMANMLAEKGNASSPLKARQSVMQSVNDEVGARMSMLMDSVGYGTDGNHLSHQIMREGIASMDDNMGALVGETEWLQEAANSNTGMSEYEPTPSKSNARSLHTSYLPGIDETVVAASSGSMLLPPIHKQREGALTGSKGENLEFCLSRWNELGTMVDRMTAASRQLAKLDMKQDKIKSEHPVGSRQNPSQKAINLRVQRRNSRAGDPNWDQW